MTVIGPDTKYMMLWDGEWRAVVNMFDHTKRETFEPMRAVAVVLALPDGEWAATLATPGELIERVDRDPKRRGWIFVDH